MSLCVCVCVTDGQTDRQRHKHREKAYIISWQHFIIWFSVIYGSTGSLFPPRLTGSCFFLESTGTLIFRRSIASLFSSSNSTGSLLLPDQLVLCSSVDGDNQVVTTVSKRGSIRYPNGSMPLPGSMRFASSGRGEECIFARRPVLIRQTLHARSANSGT